MGIIEASIRRSKVMSGLLRNLWRKQNLLSLLRSLISKYKSEIEKVTLDHLGDKNGVRCDGPLVCPYGTWREILVKAQKDHPWMITEICTVFTAKIIRARLEALQEHTAKTNDNE